MKLLTPAIFCCTWIILSGTSCKKQYAMPPTGKPASERTVQLILYTSKDFSTDNHTVTFTAFIRNEAGRVAWDSVLAPMRTKDIPAFADKIMIEKKVPGNNMARLKVGFEYYIKDVGYSWHQESFAAGDTFKMVVLNFR